ncbi:hypothetical protein ABVQ20_19670 [Mesorhizobium shangrilense]|uniref:FCD domain-containing protein n=1 Tax=Mesorhizobium shangrilense TaxID=460060 RepID=A0ABV2DGN0_9HYPH
MEMNRLILSKRLLKTIEKLLGKSHEPIVAAITSRNGELARQEMVAHAEVTFNWLVGLAKSE